MKAKDFVNEKWTEKYKRSIDCSSPKGFSQKAHCAGRKKNEDATTMPDTAIPDVKQDGKLKTALKKVGKFIGRGLGALDFVDAANKFSKGDIKGGAGSTLSGITYAIPIVGLPLGLAKDLAKEKGYDPLDYSSKAYPKGPKGETLYPMTPFENKSNMLKGILIAETHSTGTTIGSAGIGGGSGLGIEASPMTKILQGQLDEAGTRAGALNSVIQLYKSIQKGGLANEIELQQRQMRALMRKYGIGYEDIGVKPPPAQTPPPVTPSGSTNKTPKTWVDSLPSFDEPKSTSNYKPWEPEVFKEFVDTGSGGDNDDEMIRRIIEMYFEDGLRETEIAKLEGIPEVQVHNIIIKYLNGDRPLDEADEDFKNFLQKSLTNKVEPAPKQYDPNTTMGFHNMPGYSNALKFGLSVIQKMDPETKQYYANNNEELEELLVNIAEKRNLLVKEFGDPTDEDHGDLFIGGKFYEEDLLEVPGLFDEVFHDPNIGSEWSDLLKDNVKLKEYETKRIIQYSKENPPEMDYLYQQFVQRMLNPENTVDPDDWIEKVNKFYGLNYKWRDYQELGRKDHTNNWQRIIQRYVVQRP
jgi:hypothetical protein